MSNVAKSKSVDSKEQTVKEAMVNVDARKAAIAMPNFKLSRSTNNSKEIAFDLEKVATTKLSPQLKYVVAGYVHLLNERGLPAGSKVTIQDIMNVVIVDFTVIDEVTTHYQWFDFTTGKNATTGVNNDGVYNQDIKACLTCSGNKLRMKAIRLN
tara:strand:+ start:222 stop:683 length:462 start_codon:yes stop_codon:yes gene_type:complete